MARLNTKLLERITELESKRTKPVTVHIIKKTFEGQTNEAAFDHYEAKRASEGYSPPKGWESLKQSYLLNQAKTKSIEFVTIEVI
tara:strand:- start:71 stop:325 length:255 start_codon:yes stop_codon:yes gene_type:complete